MIGRRIATALAAAALLVLPLAGPAHADTVTTVAYRHAYLDHFEVPSLGRVHVEAWILQSRNSSGVVTGTVGRTQVTDVGGGVVAIQVNKSALKSAGNEISIQRNDIAENHQTPGNGVSFTSDSNDNVGDGVHSWARTLGDPNASGILRYDTNISVRWGDGQLGTYAFESLNAYWYRCNDGTGDTSLGHNCGSGTSGPPA